MWGTRLCLGTRTPHPSPGGASTTTSSDPLRVPCLGCEPAGRQGAAPSAELGLTAARGSVRDTGAAGGTKPRRWPWHHARCQGAVAAGHSRPAHPAHSPTVPYSLALLHVHHHAIASYCQFMYYFPFGARNVARGVQLTLPASALPWGHGFLLPRRSSGVWCGAASNTRASHRAPQPPALGKVDGKPGASGQSRARAFHNSLLRAEPPPSHSRAPTAQSRAAMAGGSGQGSGRAAWPAAGSAYSPPTSPCRCPAEG